jgi:hypothetical protein
MKIGKETGSLMNALLANPNYVEPKVGMDVTKCFWTDREAWRIVAVDPDKKGCKLQRYKPKMIGNFYEQRYEYEDENGNPLLCDQFMTIRYKYRAWRDGSSKIHLRFGCRDEYYDPSF